ncbi:hypothetical protein HAX54_011562, partial [Datura stramonium]|nr:hypothetical protein [Datura stramonium]
ATAPILRYIGGSRIETGDSSICLLWNSCYPSSLLIIGGSLVVRGYPPAICRCFAGAASSL